MGIETRRLAPIVLGLVTLGVFASGCATNGLPDPRIITAAYSEALRLGDVDALYALLDAESRRAVSREELATLVADSKSELRARAKALQGDSVRVEALAEVAFTDGERAQLLLEDGQFRIRAAGALPSGGRSPVDALAELRGVLARRSYAGLVRVLSSDSQAALEQRLRSLVEALEQPEALDVQIAGDEATVAAPGGHKVVLRREAGVWKVHDFQ